MRKIGEFDEQKGALRFWNYLKAQGIDSSLEEDDGETSWTIWVADEDRIERASLDFKLQSGSLHPQHPLPYPVHPKYR